MSVRNGYGGVDSPWESLRRLGDAIVRLVAIFLLGYNTFILFMSNAYEWPTMKHEVVLIAVCVVFGLLDLMEIQFYVREKEA